MDKMEQMTKILVRGIRKAMDSNSSRLPIVNMWINMAILMGYDSADQIEMIGQAMHSFEDSQTLAVLDQAIADLDHYGLWS